MKVTMKSGMNMRKQQDECTQALSFSTKIVDIGAVAYVHC